MPTTETAFALEKLRHMEYPRSINNYGTEKEILRARQTLVLCILVETMVTNSQDHITYFDMQVAESSHFLQLIDPIGSLCDGITVPLPAGQASKAGTNHCSTVGPPD